MAQPKLDKLLPILNNSGLSQSNNALYQVISQLVKIVRQLQNDLNQRIDNVPSGGGSGTGDVVGPGGSTDNAIVRFDGTSGKIIQESVITIEDTATPGTLSGTNSGDVSLVGVGSYLNLTDQVLTKSLINLDTDVTGTLPPGEGGFFPHDLLSVSHPDTVPEAPSPGALIVGGFDNTGGEGFLNGEYLIQLTAKPAERMWLNGATQGFLNNQSQETPIWRKLVAGQEGAILTSHDVTSAPSWSKDLNIDSLDVINNITADQINTSGPISAGSGLYDYSRLIPIGQAVDIPFDAADFTANLGNWVLTSPDLIVFRYTRIGPQLVILQFEILGSTISALPTILSVRLPIGWSFISYADVLVPCRSNFIGVPGVYARTRDGDRFIDISLLTAGSTFATIANGFDIGFSFPVFAVTP